MGVGVVVVVAVVVVAVVVAAVVVVEGVGTLYHAKKTMSHQQEQRYHDHRQKDLLFFSLFSIHICLSQSHQILGA